MFDTIGWGEVLVIVLAGLFIFGPERLPDLAKEAAAVLKSGRAAMRNLRGELDQALGEEFVELRDLDLRPYQPSTFIREQLFHEGDAEPEMGREL